MKLINYFKHRRTVLDVDLDESPQTRWAKAAQMVGDEIHEIVNEIVCECEALDTSDWSPWQRLLLWSAKSGGVDLGGSLVGVVARLFGQEYPSEIQGMAKAVGVSYPRLLLGNLMYVLTQVKDNYEGCPSACSSYSCEIGGDPVLVRNMDWAIPQSVGRHTVLVRFYRRNRSYTSVGIVGKIGVLSAMYPGHWAVTVNMAPCQVTGIRYFQTPALQRLRQACDQFGTFRKLVDRIGEMQTMSPFFAHVVGCKSGQQVVVNGYGRHTDEREAEEPYLIQTNHFVHAEGREYNPPGLLTDKWDTGSRYKAIRRRLKAQKPRSLEAAWKIMERRPVTHADTMQSMVMCPARDKLLLRVMV